MAGEDEFDRERAALMSRRARGLLLVLLTLWGPLYLFADPTFMPSRTFSTVVRGLTALGLLAVYRFLARPHSRRSVEWAVQFALSGLSLTWGFAVYSSIPGQELPAGISIILLGYATSLTTLMSPLGTLFLILVGNLAMLNAGAWRVDPPESSYFWLIASSLSVGLPVIVFNAVARDRTDRAAYDARAALARANDELKRQDQLRAELFTNLSHDLRTPLAVLRTEIVGLSKLQEHEPRRHREAIARMERNISATADLLDQLLELARLDSGKTPHQPAPFDLVALTRLVVGQLEPAQRTVALTASLPEYPIAISADERHVRRILTNLIANALRAVGKSGTVEVHLRCEGGLARLSVIDDGPGIPPALRGRLFTRFASFAQEGNTASGIGLALARELAKLNDGTLDWVDSATKTTFDLTFAALDEAALERVPVEGGKTGAPAAQGPPDSNPRLSGVRAAASQTLGSRPSILIVEDSDDLRASLEALLQPRFQIALAATLREALGQLEQDVPDAVLSDIMLPDGDGYELLRRVRASERLKRVPVLMVSARGEASERARGLSAGADDYLAKPFDPDELAARITLAVERAGAAAQRLQEQRQAISMELHDGPGGSLARSALLLETALAKPIDPDSRALVQDALSSVRDGIDELRLLLSMTKTFQTDWRSLTQIIERDLALGCAASGLHLRFHASQGADITLTPMVAHAVRRIAREALTNVIRHAHATHVECALELDTEQAQLRFCVEDDGCGLGEGKGAGMGTKTMQQRAEACGGSLRVESKSPGGTRVAATLRLDVIGNSGEVSLAG
jgi:signal transduction histidine kinase